MSRFVFSTFGSLGDVHPYIAVARALISRGHAAVVATSADHQAAIEGAGAEFACSSPPLAEQADYQKLVGRLFDVRSGPELLIRHMVMPNVRFAYERLLRIAVGADVLVSHPLAMALPLVGKKLHIPHVATVLAPMLFMSAHDPPVIPDTPWLRRLDFLGPRFYRFFFTAAKLYLRSWEAPLRELRREIGLKPARFFEMFDGQYSRLLNLAMFDPMLAETQPDWPAHTRVCGSALYDGTPADPAEAEDFERFAAEGDPPLVFALGSSAVWIAGDFWDRAIAAAAQLGRRAVLLTGPHSPERLPETVRAYSYLPYSQVFPHASVVIHQAGIGTLSHALRSGRPQLSVPLAFDQPDNAMRACRLGLGRTLPFRKAAAGLLALEIAELLGSPAYADSARSVAEKLDSVDGAACAAEALIELARSGGPASTPMSDAPVLL